jgi:DNA-binding transcriptional ArsR family regulator
MMNAEHYADDAVSRIAAAIGEPARARMLHGLMDQHARTSTELAVVAGVSPSTASVHLNRLKTGGLVKVVAQGKHRYYRLAGPEVARVLEGLNVIAGGAIKRFVPNTPHRLREARTCYDHLAGTLGVTLHDRLTALGWLVTDKTGGDQAYRLTPQGAAALEILGVDLEGAGPARRRFAFGCLDWSERRFHLGGVVGAALLKFMLKQKWLKQDLDSRALVVTAYGRRELQSRLGLTV